MEISTGIKAIISCIDIRYISEEWLGREFDRTSIKEMKPLVGPWGVGIDAAGEPGEYHTTVLDAPLFKEAIEITKFSRKNEVVDFGGSPNRTGNFLYMDIEEAVLKPKKSLA
jgi:diphthamide synthase (EF-2-diphthine--ammonia ligase)